MDLTLDEAAVLMNRSVRQLRYMVDKGRLKARKDGKLWRVRREDLPLSPKQLQDRLDRVDALQETVERALHLSPRPARFSLADLRAFAVGAPILRALPSDSPAADPLRRALHALAAGCHRFHPDEKSAAYRAARDLASEAACELFLADPESMAARQIEQEMMPAITGLLRRGDRRRR